MRRRKTIKPEDILVIKVSSFLQDKYPDQPFRFDQIDQIGLQNGRHNKMIHGKWSKGFPDLSIPKPNKKFAGLYLELKATSKLQDTEHTRTQSWYHQILRKLGYKCDFCIGLEDCKKKIRKYLK